ncbi:hypothetical protein [Rahnella sp. AA]|uniref:hypothetical protein n=1 Tax=Rahnella sp. AA TaxID=2057180 RepID=UPI001E5252D1|nr:hypothetical protein [Rahnella sp. AA]
MKLVYQLTEALKIDPEQIVLAQALTLNALKPRLGLKGSLGLFGSQKWWASINQKKMPLLHISGEISRAYCSGQSESGLNNTIDVVLEDGSKSTIGIYTNNKSDVQLFKIGCKIDIVYALDELKQQPALDGGVNYSKIALEMAISI